MTGPRAQDVAARLQQLAIRVPTTAVDGPADTAGRAVEVNRHRRQRAVRWVAGAVAVVVLGTATTLARPDVPPVAAAAPAAPPSTRPPAPPPAVYEQPPRGSLADDPGFLAEVAALSWSPALDQTTGTSTQIEPDTRRVVYAADVPNGHRWALVMARTRQSWAVNWFTGPDGADAADLTEASYPTLWSPTEPLALMDVSADTAPIMVFGDPGATYEYSPSLDRAPDGSLVRDFQPLPTVDGVPLGLVPTPVVWSAGELRAAAGGTDAIWDIRYSSPAPWERWYGGAGGPPDMAVLVPCLTALGYTVDVGPGEGQFGYSETGTPDRTSAEEAVHEQATAECHTAASSG
ncbi:hypothetical protein GCU67_02575 [Modestobacter muralis]|uniref:Uncharacterized protein n=1 Tax=Modestobacter muralis TaxID=1608614 RepID=A0A6P0ENA6_9ACTN|nr:hypothetical protein [Modestobacter muralis]NEK93062.1 hypothetical protein [Modestobacter muralis]NEN49829.1 hypothetical protein [Modestobacter muralis]